MVTFGGGWGSHGPSFCLHFSALGSFGDQNGSRGSPGSPPGPSGHRFSLFLMLLVCMLHVIFLGCLFILFVFFFYFSHFSGDEWSSISVPKGALFEDPGELSACTDDCVTRSLDSSSTILPAYCPEVWLHCYPKNSAGALFKNIVCDMFLVSHGCHSVST